MNAPSISSAVFSKSICCSGLVNIFGDAFYLRENSWNVKPSCRYCDVFSLACNMTGCGIDDKCGPAQFCEEKGHIEYSCGQKVSEVILKTGQKYLGDINEGLPTRTIQLFKCLNLKEKSHMGMEYPSTSASQIKWSTRGPG